MAQTNRERIARDEKVIVKLTPEIKERFQDLCEEMGVSMSAYIAVLIGQNVKQQRQSEAIMRQVMEDAAQAAAETVNKN